MRPIATPAPSAASEKPCTKCGTVKAIEAFSRKPDTRDGRNTRCKDCVASEKAARHAARLSAPRPADIIAERECRTCHVTKPITAFERDVSRTDGRSSRCNSCRYTDRVARARRNRMDPPASKACTSCHEVKPIAEFRPASTNRTGRTGRCHACWSAYERDREISDRKRAGAVRAVRDWRKRNPDAVRAHRHVAQAYASHTLQREPCELCSAPGECHHIDYSRPLDCRWLCDRCHRHEHIRLEALGINPALTADRATRLAAQRVAPRVSPHVPPSLPPGIRVARPATLPPGFKIIPRNNGTHP